MNWEIERGLRADIACYAARDLSGKRSAIQVFPGGNRKGDVRTEDLASMVIRARHGTRVVLITAPGPGWRDAPWRCIRFVAGHTIPSERRLGLPGIRVPDLDRLDPVDARRTSRDLETSYPSAADLDHGEGWTFGRIGPLKGRVVQIRIERDAPRSADLTETERYARRVVEGAAGADPQRRAWLVEQLAAGLDDPDRAEALRAWARGGG